MSGLSSVLYRISLINICILINRVLTDHRTTLPHCSCPVRELEKCTCFGSAIICRGGDEFPLFQPTLSCQRIKSISIDTATYLPRNNILTAYVFTGLLPRDRNLTYLKLSGCLYGQSCPGEGVNQIASGALSELRIENLIIQEIKIKFISDQTLTGIEGLKKLSIYGSKITQLTQLFNGVASLTHFTISDNDSPSQILSIYPNAFKYLRNLEYLNLEGNELFLNLGLFVYTRKLSYLSLRRCRFNSTTQIDLAGLNASLEVLDLSQNPLVDFNGLRYSWELDNLQELHLGTTDYSTLNLVMIYRYPNLQTLIIDFAMVRDVTGSTVELTIIGLLKEIPAELILDFTWAPECDDDSCETFCPQVPQLVCDMFGQKVRCINAENVCNDLKLYVCNCSVALGQLSSGRVVESESLTKTEF